MKLLDAVPPAIWFIRGQMRRHRKGLSILQFRALYFISANPSVSLSAVAEHLSASRPSVSRLISGMETRDLVKRSGDKDDRRLMALQITRKGQGLMDSARKATLTCIDQELKRLDKAEVLMLGKAMDLLRFLFHPAADPKDCRRGNP